MRRKALSLIRTSLRSLASLVVVLLLAVAAFAQQSPGPSRGSGTATPYAIDVRFRLTDAIDKAERESQGRAVEATLTPFPKGGGALEVTTMRPDGSLVKYRVDANTGDVVNATEQTVESYVTRLDYAALAGARLSMRQAVEAAEAHLPGGVTIGAEAESAHGGIAYEVTVMKDGSETDLSVDGDGRVGDG